MHKGKKGLQTEKIWFYMGMIEFDEKVNIAFGLFTSQQSISVAFEVSHMFKFSAKFVLMLGTLQSEGVGGIDGEHMMTIVRDSSIHPSIVPVDSTICNFKSYKERQHAVGALHQASLNSHSDISPSYICYNKLTLRRSYFAR